MNEVDFMSKLHKSTKRDYIARVIDRDFPKGKAATLAKRFDYHYWDGDRRICYEGYKYIEGRWNTIINAMKERYNLDESRILDIGAGKGKLRHEKIMPNAEIEE